MESKYDTFMAANRALLDCYGSVHPKPYIMMDPATQKDVCYSQRTKLEEILIKGKIQPADFFAAAKAKA
jgi:hypothetical protein